MYTLEEFKNEVREAVMQNDSQSLLDRIEEIHPGLAAHIGQSVLLATLFDNEQTHEALVDMLYGKASETNSGIVVQAGNPENEDGNIHISVTLGVDSEED
jgi:hypothetical protein